MKTPRQPAPKRPTLSDEARNEHRTPPETSKFRGKNAPVPGVTPEPAAFFPPVLPLADCTNPELQFAPEPPLSSDLEILR